MLCSAAQHQYVRRCCPMKEVACGDDADEQFGRALGSASTGGSRIVSVGDP